MSNEEIPPDPELTLEQESLVSALSPSQIDEIDSALLSQISSQYRKVAMVVGLAMGKLPNRVNGIPDIYYAQRVAALHDKGLIVAQGNLRSMRSSEVKLP